jgi:beta-fructofuranosidase
MGIPWAAHKTPEHFRPSRKWNGDAGINWECTNFMTLSTGTESRHFFLTDSEGGEDRNHVIRNKQSLVQNLPQRTIRWALWICGHPVRNEENGITFQYDFGGILDHGGFYAASSFNDPLTSRRIVWGWIPEEDVTLDRCRSKGWNGCLALPREVCLLKISNVARALRTPLAALAFCEVQPGPSGGFTLRTLCIRPLPDLAYLRRHPPPSFTLLNCPLPPSTATSDSDSLIQCQFTQRSGSSRQLSP